MHDLVVAADDVVLLVVAGHRCQGRAWVRIRQVDQVERRLVGRIPAVLRDRVGEHELAESRGRSDAGLIEPLRDAEVVEPTPLGRAPVPQLREGRRARRFAECVETDRGPVVLGILGGVRAAVDPVDLLPVAQVATVRDLLLQAESLGQAADRQLIGIDEGTAELADQAAGEEAAQAPAPPADVAGVGLVDGRADPVIGPQCMRGPGSGEPAADDDHARRPRVGPSHRGHGDQAR